MANHSFGGVPFRVKQYAGRATPAIVVGNESVIVTEHIDGSDNDISHNLGRRGSVEVSRRVIVDAANWASFIALRGQTATLQLIGNPAHSATLTKVGEQWDHTPASPNDFYEGDVTFLVG